MTGPERINPQKALAELRQESSSSDPEALPKWTPSEREAELVERTALYTRFIQAWPQARINKEETILSLVRQTSDVPVGWLTRGLAECVRTADRRETYTIPLGAEIRALCAGLIFYQRANLGPVIGQLRPNGLAHEVRQYRLATTSTDRRWIEGLPQTDLGSPPELPARVRS